LFVATNTGQPDNRTDVVTPEPSALDSEDDTQGQTATQSRQAQPATAPGSPALPGTSSERQPLIHLRVSR